MMARWGMADDCNQQKPYFKNNPTSCSLTTVGLLAYVGAFFSGKDDFSNGKDYSISGSITLEPTKKTMAVLPTD